MSAQKLENFLIDQNNINDIFERKIEIGAVIQFNLFQKLIEEFIKRQKLINDKVNNLEIKINSMIPINLENTEKDKKETFEKLNIKKEKMFIINQKINNNANDNQISGSQNITNKDNAENNSVKNLEKNNNINSKNIVDNSKEERYEGFINEDIIIGIPNSASTNNNYNKVNSRIDKLEIYLKELNKKIVNSNVEEKADLSQLKSDLSEMKKNDEKIKIMEKSIIKMNQALKEYNILDYFKKENNHENKDSKENNEEESSTKILIKKIEITENKTKENEEDIYKMKKGLNDINDKISMDKNNYNDFAKEVSGNFNEMKFKNTNDINYLSNLIFKNIQDLKEEFNQNISQINRKIKDMVIEEVERNKNAISNNTNNNYINLAKINNEKLNNMNNDLKNYINKSISDTEKYLKSLMNNLGIDNLKKDIINLRPEINDKLTRSDLDYIDIKLNEFEAKLNNHNLQMEKIRKDVNICNESCSNSVKRIEYLSGQVAQGYQPDLEQIQREEIAKKLSQMKPEDLQSITSKDDFDKEIKNIYRKIEQTLEVESENYKFIQHIENRLKFFVTQNELKTMEECLINIIEDLKNDFSKKFMEKSEIMKNLKIIEFQIKNIYEGIPNILHLKEGDNWLLAKKSINNYLCASCESYIGDLKDKSSYLPWNKIPSHDGKKYRMGNGFSRMLQLVNMDLMKSAKRVSKNLTIKIDDKKTNQDLIRQLPRIGSQISMRHSNHPNSTFSLNQENLENKLNNSADGLENLAGINNNSNNNSNIIQELDESEKNFDYISRNFSKNNDNQNPKVIKIVKKKMIKKNNYKFFN